MAGWFSEIWNSSQALDTVFTVTQWAMAIFGFLTAVAIVISIIASNRANSLKDETWLGERETLQTQIQQLTPRRLTPEQKVKILLALPRQPYSIRITCTMGDGESFDYASDLMEVLKEAGWTVEDNGLSQALFTGKPPPLWITVSSADEVPPAANALANAFKAAGIAVIGQIDKGLNPTQVGLFVGHKPN
ncbi:MAG TPA: hypothetical protein VND20_07940 [Candidatus Binataceae bacterium]|nr:hypothetical protein [Candidatus Binataceae bacterium]